MLVVRLADSLVANGVPQNKCKTASLPTSASDQLQICTWGGCPILGYSPPRIKQSRPNSYTREKKLEAEKVLCID